MRRGAAATAWRRAPGPARAALSELAVAGASLFRHSANSLRGAGNPQPISPRCRKSPRTGFPKSFPRPFIQHGAQPLSGEGCVRTAACSTGGPVPGVLPTGACGASAPACVAQNGGVRGAPGSASRLPAGDELRAESRADWRRPVFLRLRPAAQCAPDPAGGSRVVDPGSPPGVRASRACEPLAECANLTCAEPGRASAAGKRTAPPCRFGFPAGGWKNGGSLRGVRRGGAQGDFPWGARQRRQKRRLRRRAEPAPRLPGAGPPEKQPQRPESPPGRHFFTAILTVFGFATSFFGRTTFRTPSS